MVNNDKLFADVRESHGVLDDVITKARGRKNDKVRALSCALSVDRFFIGILSDRVRQLESTLAQQLTLVAQIEQSVGLELGLDSPRLTVH
jgi:hypothetical protein